MNGSALEILCERYVYVNESGSSSTRKGSASSEIIKFNWLLRMTINPGVEIHISLPALQQISAGAHSTYTHKPKHPSRCSHPPTNCDSDLQPPTYENTHTQGWQPMPFQSSKREIQFKVNSLHRIFNISIWKDFAEKWLCELYSMLWQHNVLPSSIKKKRAFSEPWKKLWLGIHKRTKNYLFLTYVSIKKKLQKNSNNSKFAWGGFCSICFHC